MTNHAKILLFAFIRSAVADNLITAREKELFSAEILPELYELAYRHDLAHLLAYGLNKNGLLEKGHKICATLSKKMLQAVYRFEQLNYDYKLLCEGLEKAEIAYLPLKGAVIRDLYKEPWMRTSCDIDVLVKADELEKAINYLTQNLSYTLEQRSSHDVSLFSPQGLRIELHFDLVEEGRANSAIDSLKSVWQNCSLYGGYKYRYKMTDAFFYFYHIAHMAKHFEVGGCGIKPFIDLWLLDNLEGVDKAKRDEILEKANLIKFAQNAREMSEIWFNNKPHTALTEKLENYVLRGGVYGSTENRVAFQQKKKGGKIGYFFSRIFAPYSKLKRYYPILEKHPILTPFMQVRRWFMLCRPSVRKMAKTELANNKNLTKAQANAMQEFKKEMGLN